MLRTCERDLGSACLSARLGAGCAPCIFGKLPDRRSVGIDSLPVLGSVGVHRLHEVTIVIHQESTA